MSKFFFIFIVVAIIFEITTKKSWRKLKYQKDQSGSDVSYQKSRLLQMKKY